MKYIYHDDTNHKIVLIPRYNTTITDFELYHELNDKTYTVTEFETQIVNGYLEVDFNFNAKQGNLFVYTLKSEQDLISTGKIEVL